MERCSVTAAFLLCLLPGRLQPATGCCGVTTDPLALSGCPAFIPASYPLKEQIAHFYNWTGQGGYVSNTIGQGATTLPIAGIPAGATIVQAYLWVVNNPAPPATCGDTSATACPTSISVNGVALTGTVVGTGSFGPDWFHPLWASTKCAWNNYFCTTRYDVTARVVATRNGNYVLSYAGMAETLVVVYQDLTSNKKTTVMLANGLNVWHSKGGSMCIAEDGRPPLDVPFDWSCEGNPICNPQDTKFSAFLGNQTSLSSAYHYHQLLDPVTAAVRWQGPPQPMDSVVGLYATQNVYPNPTGAFLPGESKALWRYANAVCSNKTTQYVYALALSTSCPLVPPSASISKAVDLSTAAPGDTLTYTLNYSSPASSSFIDTHNDLDGLNPPSGFYVGWRDPSAAESTFTEQGFGYAGWGAGGDKIVYNGSSAGTDGTLEVRMWQALSQAAQGIVFHYDPYAQNGYVVRTTNGSSGNDKLALYKMTGGVLTQIGSTFSLPGDPMPGTGVTVASSYFWLRVIISGCNYTLQIESNSYPAYTVGTISDCTYASGYGGYYKFAYNAYGAYDEFRWSSCASLTNVTIWDTLDPRLSYIGIVSGPTPVSGPNPLAWNIGTLACGTSGQIKFKVTFNGPFQVGACSVTNTARMNSTQLGVESSNTVSTLANPCGGTPTITPTRTVTPTSTPTPSPTPTYTATATFTPTSTATPTCTPSPTFTETPSSTPTPTATPTATPSPTFTSSPTPSHTPTHTPTFTPTNTFTPSPTPSATRTATPTSTPSSTFTASDTRTITPTATPSATETDTFSPSPTPSDTPTRTVTRTMTPTFTDSDTPTSTPTSTPTATMTDSFSPSPTPSDTATWTPTATLTDSFSPSPTPPDTLTYSPTATQTVTWTHSSTVTPSFTRTPTRTATRTFSASPTRTLSSTPTASFTVSPTASNTPLPLPYQVKVVVYNAAGEAVALLFNGGITQMPGAPTLQGSVVQSGLSGVALVFDGMLSSGSSSLEWLGQTDAGQLTQGGIYYLHVTVADSFGAVSSYSYSIPVLEAKARNQINIFNSAGELVYQQSLMSMADTMTGLVLFQEAFAPPQGSLKGELRGMNGSSTAWTWDGKNSQGQLVTGGMYTIQLLATTESGEENKIMRQVQVLAAKDSLEADPRVLDLPLSEAGLAAQGGIELHFHAAAVAMDSVRGKLFGLNGNLVAEAGPDASKPGRLLLPAPRLAAGIYLVSFEYLTPSGTLKRKLVKAAVIR